MLSIMAYVLWFITWFANDRSLNNGIIGTIRPTINSLQATWFFGHMHFNLCRSPWALWIIHSSTLVWHMPSGQCRKFPAMLLRYSECPLFSYVWTFTTCHYLTSVCLFFCLITIILFTGSKHIGRASFRVILIL